MSTLYEIDARYFDLLNKIEECEGDISPELSAELEISEVDFGAKVLAYRNFITLLRGEEELADKELKRIAAYKARKDRDIERLKNALDNAMQLRGLDKYSDGALVNISYRKSNSVVVDENILPSKWFITKKTPNKVEIAKVLKSGKKIVGAEMKENKNIQIK